MGEAVLKAVFAWVKPKLQGENDDDDNNDDNDDDDDDNDNNWPISTSSALPTFSGPRQSVELLRPFSTNLFQKWFKISFKISFYKLLRPFSTNLFQK